MLWEFLKNRAKRAVLEGVAEAADEMGKPGHEEQMRAPVAVVVGRLEARLLGPAPEAIPVPQPPARRPKTPADAR